LRRTGWGWWPPAATQKSGTPMRPRGGLPVRVLQPSRWLSR
jgi:hypothetical protein